MPARISVPIFSICIPAHNPFPLLETALDSVVSQTFADWEVVIVDDCSELEVEPRLKKRRKGVDNKIKCIRLSENKGPLYARRVAFRACSGAYILCLDADDELLGPDVLEELYSRICAAETSPDVVLFNATTNKAEQNPWVDYKSLGFYEGSLCRDSVVRCFLKAYRLNNLCLKAIKRELLLPARLDDATGLYMCEDRLEVAGVFVRAENYLLIDRPLYFYRQNPESTTHRKFQLDYCRQQTFVDKAIANMFSAEFSLSGLYELTLHVWVDDMCRITWGRNLAEAVGCFRVMAGDPFYREACESIGIRGLRADRRLLLWLLNNGRFVSAAIAANMRMVLLGLLKGYMR